MEEQIRSYKKLKEKGYKYTDIENKRKVGHGYAFWRYGYLAFDELLENQKKLEQKNQELEAKLDQIIKLLESK